MLIIGTRCQLFVFFLRIIYLFIFLRKLCNTNGTVFSKLSFRVFGKHLLWFFSLKISVLFFNLSFALLNVTERQPELPDVPRIISLTPVSPLMGKQKSVKREVFLSASDKGRERKSGSLNKSRPHDLSIISLDVLTLS